MQREVSCHGESCIERYPDPGTHTQRGILAGARGVMQREVSWHGESCIERYPDPGTHTQRVILAGDSGSHAERGILAQGVMYRDAFCISS